MNTLFKRIAVIGLGSLGSEVCKRLGESGFHGEVFLIDDDRLEARNIPASRTYTDLVQDKGQEALGQLKSELIRMWFSVKHPFIRWHSIPSEIADCGWQVLQSMDLFITCTDSIASRAETAYIARTLAIPMIDGGVPGAALTGGRAAYYSPHPKAACYLCGLTESKRAEILTLLSATTHGCLTISWQRAMDSSVESSLSIQRTAATIVKTCLLPEHDNNSVEIKLLRNDAEELLHLTLSSDCPWHNDPPHLLAPGKDAPVSDSLPSGDWSLTFPWSMVLSSFCDTCRQTCDVPMRMGYLRRKGLCPQCGTTASLTPLETVNVIHADSPWAKKSAQQLGLPEKHLLVLRKRIQQNSVQRSV